jgi:hypothetical protein
MGCSHLMTNDFVRFILRPREFCFEHFVCFDTERHTMLQDADGIRLHDMETAGRYSRIRSPAAQFVMCGGASDNAAQKTVTTIG